MGMNKTLGGDRLGSGKRMKVHLHGYERSNQNLGYLWRSTMAAGTLVPYLSKVALPGDTFDITLDCDIKTHPTIGPLFGSYKVQLDVFQAPIRLYQGLLHNNKLGIGMNMAQVKLPVMRLRGLKSQFVAADADESIPVDNLQVNPSCILSYLGLRGIGWVDPAGVANAPFRDFNAVPLLAYWDIYKQYYSNKQEEIGAVIHSTPLVGANLSSMEFNKPSVGNTTIPQAPTGTLYLPGIGDIILLNHAGTEPDPDAILLNTSQGQITLTQATVSGFESVTGVQMRGAFNYAKYGALQVYSWQYVNVISTPLKTPEVVTFPLENIDEMREAILAAGAGPYEIFGGAIEPYSYLGNYDSVGFTWTQLTQNQEGLGVKTYQSDLFNNWLSTEWIDGPGGINEITAIDTSGGSFNIDTLVLSRKVYDMLNRIAVSGGTYDDWLDAVYTHDRYTRCESPIYHGGLSKELVFQEVISNSETQGVEGGQPLGTLAGKGVMSKKHKGGSVIIKVDEPSYIIGIVSLTPRVDYSQGNSWDLGLETMDDFHKPALDEIGFQELITEKMAWWTTHYDPGSTTWVQKSAGKQPAWIDYMTSVNEVRGNFADPNSEMFMTLNRRYEADRSGLSWDIQDLTTYIDPVKFNHIFAQTSIDAQNFWCQIAVDITARRKMSAKVMPNL